MAVGFVIGVSCYSNSISYYYKIIYFNTIELDVFINAADIVTILSIVATLVSEGRLINVIGITPCRIVYLLRNKPILFLHGFVTVPVVVFFRLQP